MILEIVLGLIVLTEGYVIWNLFRKLELVETWVEEFTQRIETVQTDLKVIDDKGAFESDDEVGTIFEQIKETVNKLASIILKKGDLIEQQHHKTENADTSISEDLQKTSKAI